MATVGIAFRVDNKRLRNHGRLSVAQADFGPLLMPDDDVSRTIAVSFPAGRLIPGELAYRLYARKLGRFETWHRRRINAGR